MWGSNEKIQRPDGAKNKNEEVMWKKYIALGQIDHGEGLSHSKASEYINGITNIRTNYTY